MTIKERVQILLKEKGISAMQMENDLGFAKGYISKLDKASPTADKLLKMADYLDVPTDALLKDDASRGKRYSVAMTHADAILKEKKMIQENLLELDKILKALQDENIATKEELEFIRMYNSAPEDIQVRVRNELKASQQIS